MVAFATNRAWLAGIRLVVVMGLALAITAGDASAAKLDSRALAPTLGESGYRYRSDARYYTPSQTPALRKGLMNAYQVTFRNDPDLDRALFLAVSSVFVYRNAQAAHQALLALCRTAPACKRVNVAPADEARDSWTLDGEVGGSGTLGRSGRVMTAAVAAGPISGILGVYTRPGLAERSRDLVRIVMRNAEEAGA